MSYQWPQRSQHPQVAATCCPMGSTATKVPKTFTAKLMNISEKMSEIEKENGNGGQKRQKKAASNIPTT